jgi:hypothetical protein
MMRSMAWTPWAPFKRELHPRGRVEERRT